uniref:Uncharacterized protein n=1 Tax=Arundo donax TaxID=35708 RepID=A0A0A9FMH3_ARUDO
MFQVFLYSNVIYMNLISSSRSTCC